MKPYIAFLVEHWLLSCAFIVILLLFLVNEWRYQWRFRSAGLTAIDPVQLVNLLNHAGGVVVDLRDSVRFEAGHIISAMNIPQADMGTRLNLLNKYKSKPIILICAQGTDAPKVGIQLKAKGFTQLFYLAGGMGKWVSENMPTTKK